MVGWFSRRNRGQAWIVGNNDFNCCLMGSTFCEGDLKDLYTAGGTLERNQEFTAQLIPEDENPYHRNSIGVAIDGKIVGYLPRNEATHLRKLLKSVSKAEQPVHCVARLTIHRAIASSGGYAYRVKIDLPQRTKLEFRR